jgi:O-antigen ligase
MAQTFPATSKNRSIIAQERRNQLGQWLWLFVMLGSTVFMAGVMLLKQPDPSQIAWICFFLGVVAILFHPRNGVYLIVGLTLVGDVDLSPWYPFNKNLSSPESLMYVGRALSFAPLEIALALTFVVWILRMAFQRKWEIRINSLFIPIILFTIFAGVGMAYGFGRGGDRGVGLAEVRALFYILPMALLVRHLITTRTHVQILTWIILIAIGIKGIIGTMYVADVLNFQLAGVESIGEHALSIHFNVFFVMFISVWMFRGSHMKRLIMPMFLPFVFISFIANNRRASFICLAIVFVIIAFILYRFDRERFWLIVPVVGFIGLLYIAVFWNANGALGAPAKAIRSVIGTPDPRDAGSNAYRVLENTNIMFTIKLSPIFGVGFGQKFYILMPMADISFFIWWQYITHNSILWIWMKMGIGGFVSLLAMIGMSISYGMRTIWQMPGDEMAGAAMLAVCYIIMHFIFAYVDMSWGGTNMIMIATMMGLIISLVAIVAQKLPIPPKRWPWQRDAQPLPGLRPIQGEQR